MRTPLALLLATVAVLLGSPAQAHTGSYDMKYVDGANVVLLTFNTHQPVSGLDIAHNIRLYDLVGAPVPYDEVEVEIHTQSGQDGVEGLESTRRLQATVPMLPTNESELDFTYPSAGPYRLTATFWSGEQQVAEGVFAIDVGQGTGAPSRWGNAVPLIVAFLTGAVLAVVVAAIARSVRRRRTAGDEGPPDEPGAAVLELVGAGQATKR